MTKSEINAYSNRIACATKTELVVIMYEIAKSYILSATECYESSDMEGFKRDLKKAKQFVNELNTSLNLEYRISYDLMSIYLFMNRTLLNAIIRESTENLSAVAGMLDKLHDAFAVVSSQDESGPVMKNVQTVYAGLTYSKNNLNEMYDSQANRGFRV